MGPGEHRGQIDQHDVRLLLQALMIPPPVANVVSSVGSSATRRSAGTGGRLTRVEQADPFSQASTPKDRWLAIVATNE